MTAHPSPDAIRAKLGREKRALATPPDVKALLDRGRKDREELLRQSRAVCALGQIEATAAARIVKIQRTKQPAIRARLLGELADWIIERRETLAEAAGIRTMALPRARSYRRLPRWVPDDLVDVYRDPTLNEFEAAALVRRMKREATA